jgi:hypothetical protein
MKNFLAIYTGTADKLGAWNKLPEAQRNAREQEGIKAWMAWGEKHASVIVEQGSPLGKTKRVDTKGITDIKNAMTGYVVVRADSHEAAAKLFEGHPHFTIFPGDGVEIMECLPMPEH